MNRHYKKKVYQNWLCKTFPKCFNGSIRPLSIGIFDELAEQLPDEFSKAQLQSFITWYTRRIDYYEACCHTVFRVNLEGSDTEEISVQEKEDAQLNLIKLYLQKAEVNRKTLEEQKRKAIARHEFLLKLA